MGEVVKSRNLTKLEYLEALQLEYISIEVRRKIYPHTKDKDYYGRVLVFKKETINKIALINSLPTIFTDTELFQKLYRQIVPIWGLPSFTYKDEDEYESLRRKDVVNFFCPGSDVKIKTDNTFVLGKIISNQYVFPYREDLTVKVKVTTESSNRIVTTSCISRIL